MQRIKQGIATTVCIAVVTAAIIFYICFLQDKTVEESVSQIQWVTIILISSVFVIVGVLIIIYLLFRNRKKIDEKTLELDYQKQLFGMLSDKVDDIFIMLNPVDLYVEYISPNVERLVGVTVSEVKQDVKVLRKAIVNHGERYTTECLREVELGQSKSFEREYIHRVTGDRRWYRETIYHINIQETEKYVLVLSDRTVEVQMNRSLEDALETARIANESKSTFLSNMSHDIRTPMNAITGFAVLLAKDCENPEKVREYTRKIAAASQHLLGIINDVLDMSKIESGSTTLNVEEFSFSDLLEEIQDIIIPQIKAKDQEFIMHVQGNVPEMIQGDKLRINQILLNLLSNAVKYTPQRGRVELRITNLSLPSSHFANLKFEVIDNGIGMSKEFINRVYEPFAREVRSATNKVQGTGLGMAIAKNLVDLMGGTISVKSEMGKGSTFTVELQFAISEQKRDKAFWKHHGISRVLVAGAEEEVCYQIQAMMEGTGVEMNYIADSRAAVELAKTAHEEQQDFNVILLDWKMPGINGIETVCHIREMVGREVPVFVLVDYDWSDIEEEARKAGVDAFMPKPFFASVFQQKIEQHFRRQENSSLKGMRFLVAEDNELNAEILGELLDIEGAECEFTVDGQEAVEAFRKSAPGYYDMILMDIQMPVMNGYEAARAIRSMEHPSASTIPIAAMTANAFAEDVKNAFAAGMNAHISKPVVMEVLKSTIKALRQKDIAELTGQ